MDGPRSKSKQLIANAALDEFAEHGYAGARTDRIARRAGVNKQLIYYYYGSKAKLFDAVCRTAAQHLSSEAIPRREVASATEKFRSQLRSLFEAIQARPALASLLIRGVQGDGDDAAREWGKRTVALIAETISEGQGLGFFRDEADPVLKARQSVALLLGYFALRPMVDGDVGSDAAWLEGATELLLGSLVW